MKVKQLIKKLKKFDGGLEVSITDGWEAITYDLEEAVFQKFLEDKENNIYVLDIGVGGCRMEYE